jgi:diguanylate cyclase (GGDEF)-like protein
MEIAFARRHKSTLSVLMIDLEHLRAINDRFGPHGGDRALRQVADLLRGTVRESDSIFRLGGDEFLVLMRNTDSKQALNPARRFLARLDEGRPVHRQHRDVGDLRVSIGICSAPQDAQDADELIRRADEAVALSKRLGTGVEIWRPTAA